MIGKLKGGHWFGGRKGLDAGDGGEQQAQYKKTETVKPGKA